MRYVGSRQSPLTVEPTPFEFSGGKKRSGRLAVIFECQADPARVGVTDHNGIFWEIPTTAVCTVPEGHL
jgi:hypothetical protein